MKRTMVSLLVLCLVLACLAGCSRVDDTQKVEPTPNVDTTIVPEDNNGVVEDGNGIIGDNDRVDTNDGVLPEIGAGIEEGANDIIDGVDNAIEGNDNNAGDMTRGRKIR
ncbi:MAG: hypothetical protein IKV79_00195 [Oscillospiraceae bacterium]|nr:hypothetical protein [Oscillospiraceae bacterium]